MEEGYGEGRWRIHCTLMGSSLGCALFDEAMGLLLRNTKRKWKREMEKQKVKRQ